MPFALLLIIFFTWTEKTIPMTANKIALDSVTPANPIALPKTMATGMFTRPLTITRYNCSLILPIPFKKYTTWKYLE